MATKKVEMEKKVDKAETLHGQLGPDSIHSIHGLGAFKFFFHHENWLLTLVAMVASSSHRLKDL